MIWMLFPRRFQRILQVIAPSDELKIKAGMDRLGLKVWGGGSQSEPLITEQPLKKMKKKVNLIFIHFSGFPNSSMQTILVRTTRHQPSLSRNTESGRDTFLSTAAILEASGGQHPSRASIQGLRRLTCGPLSAPASSLNGAIRSWGRPCLHLAYRSSRPQTLASLRCKSTLLYLVHSDNSSHGRVDLKQNQPKLCCRII